MRSPGFQGAWFGVKFSGCRVLQSSCVEDVQSFACVCVCVQVKVFVL